MTTKQNYSTPTAECVVISIKSRLMESSPLNSTSVEQANYQGGLGWDQDND